MATILKGLNKQVPKRKKSPQSAQLILDGGKKISSNSVH